MDITNLDDKTKYDILKQLVEELTIWNTDGNGYSAINYIDINERGMIVTSNQPVPKEL